jgi:DNA-binding IclR family transcriptional regulator
MAEPNSQLVQKITQAIRELQQHSDPVNLSRVARQSGVPRSTIYRYPALRQLVEEVQEHSELQWKVRLMRREVAELRRRFERHLAGELGSQLPPD